MLSITAPKIQAPIDYIVHISDIHIRNFDRHEEYLAVFKNLYINLNELKAKHKFIVCITGDIVHSKNNITPELVDVVQKFIKEVANIAEYTIIVPGNHDLNLSNADRLDALAPIIDAIGSNKIFYFREEEAPQTLRVDTGSTSYVFKHYPMLEPAPIYLPKNAVNGKKEIHIGIFHGVITGTQSANGMILTNPLATPSTFSSDDFTLLGDIHQIQSFANPVTGRNTIAYAGSFIQQNFGEGANRGYLLWDMNTNSIQTPYEFIPIYNPYEYVTFTDQNSVTSYLDSCLPKTKKILRVRIKVETKSQYDVIENFLYESIKPIKKYVEIESIVYKPSMALSTDGFSDTNKNYIDVGIDYDLVTMVDIENYIREYCEHEGYQDVYDEVKTLYKKYAGTIDNAKPAYTWSLDSISFSNVFSYGPSENKVDFTDKQGVVAIFAPNRHGKTSISESICYALFDKCHKTSSAANVLRRGADDFEIQLNATIDGTTPITISRVGKLNKKTKSVKVDVNITSEADIDAGEVTTKNGVIRYDSNAELRKMFGTYKDFSVTAYSPQDSGYSFVNLEPKDRKDMLIEYFGIANISEINGQVAEELRVLKRVTIDAKQIAKYKEDIDQGVAKQTELQALISANEQEVETLTAKETQLNSVVLQHTDGDANWVMNPLISEILPKDCTVVDVENSIQSFTKDVEKFNLDLTEKYQNKTITSNKLDATRVLLDSSNHIDIQTFEDSNKKIRTLSAQIQTITNQLNNASQQKDLLKDYKYDPSCNYCVENPFTKNAIALAQQVIELEQKLEEAKKALQDCEQEHDVIKSNYEVYSQLKNEESVLEKELTKQDVSINKVKQTVMTFNTLLIELNLHKNYLERNKSVLSKENVEKVNELQSIQKELDRLNQEQMRLRMETSKIEGQVELTQKLLDTETAQNKSVETQRRVYSALAEITSRDGVQSMIIKKTLPYIEAQLNAVIDNIDVNFSVKLQYDTKGIETLVVAPGGISYPVEMVSGMEKLIIGIAARTALSQLKPIKPDFFVIDEGFGSLELKYKEKIINLLDYLKERFTKIILITHVTELKDLADHLVEIKTYTGENDEIISKISTT